MGCQMDFFLWMWKHRHQMKSTEAGLVYALFVENLSKLYLTEMYEFQQIINLKCVRLQFLLKNVVV
jgi:hypothetical protein